MNLALSDIECPTAEDSVERLSQALDRLVARGPTPAVWKAIQHPDTMLAIFERTLPEGLSEIASLKSCLDIDAIFPVAGIDDALAEDLTQAGYADTQCRSALIEDITMLAGRFSSLLDIDDVHIRLEWVTGDACKKFHADFVTVRAICTYFGRGTEWTYGLAAPTAPSLLENIEQMPCGHVGVFKGRLRAPGLIDLLHRSPPIKGTGERRLLLVINAPVQTSASGQRPNLSGSFKEPFDDM